MPPAFIASSFATAKITGATSCPSTDERIRRRGTRWIFLSHKSEWRVPFAATWKDLEGTTPSELGQTERDAVDLTCMWNLKNAAKWRILQSRSRRTDTEGKLVRPEVRGQHRGVGVGGASSLVWDTLKGYSTTWEHKPASCTTVTTEWKVTFTSWI